MAYSNLTHLTNSLLERAEAALQRTVAAAPHDAAALLRLGDVQRGRGRLGEALQCYRQVLSLRPGDSKASWLAAVLSGKALPEALADAPAPFVRRTDFLPPPRCSQLLAFAQTNREQFKPAAIGPYRRVDASVRKLLVEHRATQREVQPWFEVRLRDAFPEVLARLRMPEPREYSVEMSMSAYLHGDFSTKHIDNVGEPFRTRTLSFAYYFHRRPRRFVGGDLLLHDTNDPASTFTRIEPEYNSIVFFPPWRLHEITAVEEPSAGGARGAVRSHEPFGDARLAIHGWLRTRSAESPSIP